MADPTPLKIAKEAAAMIESLVKSLAVVIGGVWVYYKFIKDRIYRPRFELQVDGTVSTAGGAKVFICRLSVKNIGESKIELLQEGTGVLLATANGESRPFKEPDWVPRTVYEVFKQHDWIESGETITHDMTVPLEDNTFGFRLRLHPPGVVRRAPYPPSQSLSAPLSTQCCSR